MITMAIEAGPADNPGNVAVTGPIVGLLTWGSGLGGSKTAEFDIPVQLAPFSASINMGSGGVLVTVPASTVELNVRHDGNLLVNAGGARIGGQLTAAGVDVNIAVGERGGSSMPLRTVWGVYGGPGLAALAAVAVAVPPFAEAFKIMRSDAGNAINVEIVDWAANVVDGPYNIPANIASPVFDLPNGAVNVRVTNVGAGAIARVAAVFEIGI